MKKGTFELGKIVATAAIVPKYVPKLVGKIFYF